jgi:DinB family protein
VTAKTATQESIGTTLIGRWEQAGAKLAALGEEFPAEAYESALVDGIRTCGDVLRHVAFWNIYVGDTIRGKKADDSGNELPKAEYADKKSVLGALRRSVADSAQALKEFAAWDAKAIETVLSFLEHTSEHYGQLVVYARMKGIVPPASRS